MQFQNWLFINESNLQSLYSSTVKAFPRTLKRQYSIDPIKIIELKWLPFLGMKTLFVKGLAHSDESGKDYNSMILFKGVNYQENKNKKNLIEIIANDGNQYIFEKINQKNEVLVRCDCKDFLYRFNYFNHKDESLYGKVRKKYEAKINPGSSNPSEMPGLCKHLIKLAKALDQSGILED
jgi:hypothetical protein